MKFESYKITKIDEVKGHIYVSFTFSDGKEKTVVDKKMDYRALTGSDQYERKEVEEEYLDKKGNKKKRIVEVPVKVLVKSQAIDLGNASKLTSYFTQWAEAYLRGKEQEEANKNSASDEVKKLIGKTVSL